MAAIPASILLLMMYFPLALSADADGSSSTTSDTDSLGYPLLSQICNPNKVRGNDGAIAFSMGDSSAVDSIRKLIGTGNVPMARRVAYECLSLIHNHEHTPNAKSSMTDGNCCPSSAKEVNEAYKQSADAFFLEHEDFMEILRVHQFDDDSISTTTDEHSKCWDDKSAVESISLDETMGFSTFGIMENDIDTGMSRGSAAIERWNKCCSFFRANDNESTCNEISENTHLCCELAAGLDNHLILPALREPSVTVRLQFNDTTSKERKVELVNIEQEGSLRMFDVSGVLWPAGYLVGLCLSDPIACGAPEVLDAVADSLDNSHPIAIELGAGVGFPSIAFAKAVKYLKRGRRKGGTNTCEEDMAPVVLATDISNASLALITSNTHKNGLSGLVAAQRANHSDPDSLHLMTQQAFLTANGERVNKDGFDVIIGSSLQALFDGTSQQSAALWQSLDVLLSKDNPNAVVILSHVRTSDERIELPIESSRFECIRRISGDSFDMKTRDGNSSDFELILLRRRLK